MFPSFPETYRLGGRDHSTSSTSAVGYLRHLEGPKETQS